MYLINTCDQFFDGLKHDKDFQTKLRRKKKY